MAEELCHRVAHCKRNWNTT